MSVYVAPDLIKRMCESLCWPISVRYPRDGTAVVECGRWGFAGGWIRYEERFKESELPESVVAGKYQLQENQP